MVGIAIRKTGQVEFYSDFMLVEEYWDPDMLCVDVRADFDLFYLKFLIVSDNLEKYYKIPQEWRNRIGMNTSKLMKETRKFEICLHRRISNYFNLYSGLVNFQTFMIVSHRNHISVFDMTKAEWIKDSMYSFN